jgi:hypothetical protein
VSIVRLRTETCRRLLLKHRNTERSEQRPHAAGIGLNGIIGCAIGLMRPAPNFCARVLRTLRATSPRGVKSRFRWTFSTFPDSTAPKSLRQRWNSPMDLRLRPNDLRCREGGGPIVQRIDGRDGAACNIKSSRVHVPQWIDGCYCPARRLEDVGGHKTQCVVIPRGRDEFVLNLQLKDDERPSVRRAGMAGEASSIAPLFRTANTWSVIVTSRLDGF